MNDFGEALPINITAAQEVGKEDHWRPTKVAVLEGRAEAITWGKSITGRRVDFPQKDGKSVWGIEIEIPLFFEDVEDTYREALTELDEKGKKMLTEDDIKAGIETRKNRRFYSGTPKLKLGANIRKIKILDMSPQEALPKSLRNIDSTRTFYHAKPAIVNLTRQPGNTAIDRLLIKVMMHSTTNSKRSTALDGLFFDVFGDGTKKQKVFESVMADSDAEELVFIHAHGGYDNTIGEQTGNWINLEEVITRYNNPDQVAAILVSSCYLGQDSPPVDKVPVFRPKGFTGGYRSITSIGKKTLVSLPTKE